MSSGKGLPLPKRRLRWAAAILLILALVAIGVQVLSKSNRNGPKGTGIPGSKGSGTAYTVSGNRIIGPHGPYVPYGVVLWCLSAEDLSCNQHTSASPNSDSDKINAAATYWHANTVRIQVAYEHVFAGPGGAVDGDFVAQLDGEIALANSRDMVAIVTQQTERFNGSLMPDAKSTQFWKYMSAHYANNPKVFFDLFNEPRLNTNEFGGTVGDEWNLWRNGGTVTLTGASAPTTYVGMQTLVDLIRSSHAENPIIAEGNHGDHDLSLLSTHLLTGPGVAYGMEPSLYPRSTFAQFWLNRANETPAEWSANWGDLSQTYPIMIEAFNDHPGGGCYANSSVVLPQLLSYLKAHGLGMIFFSLDPGVGVVGNNLQVPTSFRGPLDCSGKQIDPNSSEGAGALVKAWFAANSQAP